MATRGWFGFDLDGTLAKYSVWNGPDKIGAPIPLMVEKVKELLSQGRDVRIFTARVASNQPEGHIEIARKAIEDWCELHIGQPLIVTAEKDQYLIEYYDDRAIQVEFNTGKILTFEIEKNVLSKGGI